MLFIAHICKYTQIKQDVVKHKNINNLNVIE